jgi:hypothetical protein
VDRGLASGPRLGHERVSVPFRWVNRVRSKQALASVIHVANTKSERSIRTKRWWATKTLEERRALTKNAFTAIRPWLPVLARYGYAKTWGLPSPVTYKQLPDGSLVPFDGPYPKPSTFEAWYK